MESENVQCFSEAPDAPNSWAEYFPGEFFSEGDRRASLIRSLIDVFHSQEGRKILSQAILDGPIYSLPADFQILQKLCPVDELFAAIDIAPREALSCLGAAAYEVLFCSGKEPALAGRVNVRLHNHPDSKLALKYLKAASIGRLISIRGTVVRMSAVKPLVVRMGFTCTKCRTTIQREFPDGKYFPLSSCTLVGCRSKTFTPETETAQCIDFQKIRIQEILSHDNHEVGRIPRTVEVELTEDLVDTCIPADVVTVCGIVKAINPDTDIGGRGKNKNPGLFYLYIEAVSITNSKNQISGHTDDERDIRGTEYNGTTFTDLDLEFVARFAAETGPDLFRHILHSICPSIYGQELVKAGIALALFGGVQKHLMDDNKVPVRGDIHVMVVGDPGLGKSQLLQASAAVAARGIYVCGNTTTTAGLTVAVVKDAVSGDYVFEAGAMVLADRGMCCIDEFDKLSAEHQALLESMEQQCVSVAKAGLVASLSARTSVLAAANPVGGRYNRAKTVNENLKMSAALLSRFDLVFILLDKPDEMLDQHLSEHIMSLHAGSVDRQIAAKKAFSTFGAAREMRVNSSLAKRLKLDPHADRDFAPLPAPLLRKYIAYAKEYVFPRMSEAAAGILKEFYLQLRKGSRGTDGTPITARQLESLVRLAEARAKLELRDEITSQDALDVVEIMKESLLDKFMDEHGVVDYGRSGGLSQQKEAKRFLNALQQRSSKQQNACFTISEMYSLADEMVLRVPDLDTFIDNLNQAGYLLKKGHRSYQVQSSSYSGTQRGSQSRAKH